MSFLWYLLAVFVVLLMSSLSWGWRRRTVGIGYSRLNAGLQRRNRWRIGYDVRFPLKPFRFRQSRTLQKQASRRLVLEVPRLPYAYARMGSESGKFLDLSTDTDLAKLARWKLPVFSTPQELAAWLEIPLNTLAWLIHRCQQSEVRSMPVKKMHYHYCWVTKRSGGMRLIEAPKAKLKRVQEKILRQILDRVPTHPAAHGFVKQRDIVTNAKPHVGKLVLVKFDLQDFYAGVSFNRVIAIYRGLGYSRDAAIWLASLTTTPTPTAARHPKLAYRDFEVYSACHLPQGAPTSPALANLSAFGLDVRLSGLARRFGGKYTRYADDLTLSGNEEFSKSLRLVLPMTKRIICGERFRWNPLKVRVERRGRRQRVAGVIVNDRISCVRSEFDALKATLYNCVKRGPASQNRHNDPEFAAHLMGRIAHIRRLNSNRGAKLLQLYQEINW
jgi:RNA-directed DNA polymerase